MGFPIPDLQPALPEIFLLSADADNNYLGVGAQVLANALPPAILVADILEEIDSVLRVVGEPGAVEQLRFFWRRLCDVSASFDDFYATLPEFIERLQALPRKADPSTCPRVVVTGDFFTRFSAFVIESVPDLYAENGIILKPVDLADLIQYGTYDGLAGAAQVLGMKPGGLAFAKACTRFFQPDGKKYLQQWLTYQARRRIEDHYRGLFRRTGLLVAASNDVSSLFVKASEHVSPALYGETIPTVGKGLDADREGYDGIIVIGPFNCLPYRISEAILKPLSIRQGMPILTYESDGYPVSASVLRQAEVHIQQVLERSARRRENSRSITERISELFAAQTHP